MKKISGRRDAAPYGERLPKLKPCASIWRGEIDTNLGALPLEAMRPIRVNLDEKMPPAAAGTVTRGSMDEP